jgi:hypothetical protein
MTKTGPESFANKEWNDILDKMIFAFEYIVNEDKYTDKCYPKNYNYGFDRNNEGKLISKDKRKPNWKKLEPYEKRYNFGMELFKTHFRSLWD